MELHDSSKTLRAVGQLLDVHVIYLHCLTLDEVPPGIGDREVEDLFSCKEDREKALKVSDEGEKSFQAATLEAFERVFLAINKALE